MLTTTIRTSALARLGWLPALALALALLAALTAPMVHAQSEDQSIVSTVQGEVPTTGAFRPGPAGDAQAVVVPRPGVAPVSISIPALDINSEIETIQVVNGRMQDPTGPWVVSWYRESSRLGEGLNTVMAGHLDYWDVGPAIFYNIGDLAVGDDIEVIGDDGLTYRFTVAEEPVNYDVANAPIQEIVGAGEEPMLTLITCGGPFDYTTGEYLQRTVVRAEFAGMGTAT